MLTHPLEEILHPKSIAVVGATVSPDGHDSRYIAPLLEYGYQGKIYPVNPKYSEILGLKVYPSLRDIPFYPTIGRAAEAARKLIDYYQRRE